MMAQNVSDAVHVIFTDFSWIQHLWGDKVTQAKQQTNKLLLYSVRSLANCSIQNVQYTEKFL